MFFFRIERLDDLGTMKQKISTALESDSFTVIPLVSPDCTVGRSLMDQESLKDISDESDPNVNIFYIDRDIKGEFSRFMDQVLSEARDISGETVNAPALLVFFPKRENLVTIEVDVEDKPIKFRTAIYQLIAALQSGEPLKNIELVKYKVNSIYVGNDHSHLIRKVYRDVFKFFT